MFYIKYVIAISRADRLSFRFFQQGNHIDVSPYTFEELMTEISA